MYLQTLMKLRPAECQRMSKSVVTSASLVIVSLMYLMKTYNMMKLYVHLILGGNRCVKKISLIKMLSMMAKILMYIKRLS